MFWNECINENRKSLTYYDPENTIFNKELNKYLKF